MPDRNGEIMFVYYKDVKHNVWDNVYGMSNTITNKMRIQVKGHKELLTKFNVKTSKYKGC